MAAPSFKDPDKGGKMPPKDYEDDGIHRSQSKSNWFPDDIRLRDFGFHLFARPKGKSSVWIKDHNFYTHEQALYEVQKMIESCERHDK